MPFQFQLTHTDKNSRARVGKIKTFHGDIDTPIFMPVGTQASVKSLSAFQLNEAKAQIILGNTYHLYLRPGIEVIKNAGGLHKFQNWNKPILTDSGGYQVFSLKGIRTIKNDGVEFKSHIDGSKHFFTPEKVIEIQKKIGADIIMAFDECAPYPCEYSYAQKSLNITHKWLKNCLDTFDATPDEYDYFQTIFPIVQGSVYKDLRKESCDYLTSLNRDGYAIGGLSVGEEQECLYDLTNFCCENLPKEKPRYLMGVGTPKNILDCIELGVDMFDCVMPSRNGRNATLFTSNGVVHILNQKWKNDFSPIDANLPNSPLSQHYSKSYLRHLFMSKELLAYQIATMQNIAFYLDLVQQARKEILNNNFVNWKKEILPIITQKL